ncbi:MAG: Triosephosphate isomerase [Hydrocarboniphaga sp.]|uniref:triose-phosphate isomerase n=1 Tax=Hydrocarboniphaga sp. TaxID=2033016 RepID=UPI002604DAF7|nr:triose-phosphate isomerase [Hydrocarboniphaga sp.]MDB5970746.1 Triosephosphate isomerase [Hydrocarboniphaga sp.]
MTRQYLVAGNWKMNGSLKANAELLSGIAAQAATVADVELMVCPPSVYLDSVGRALSAGVALGAQNLSEQAKPGAFTGEVHGTMLVEFGCRYVLVGHSERRALYGETDQRVAEKYQTAQTLGLIPVLCIGETLEERESGATELVLSRQLDAVLDRCGIASFQSAVVAYEPVWAIGTGKTASREQAQAAHAFLRGLLAGRDAKIAGSTRLLYGGSCRPDNAHELFSCADIDGGLIGGASLKASDFLAIAAAAQSLSKA